MQTYTGVVLGKMKCVATLAVALQHAGSVPDNIEEVMGLMMNGQIPGKGGQESSPPISARSSPPSSARSSENNASPAKNTATKLIGNTDIESAGPKITIETNTQLINTSKASNASSLISPPISSNAGASATEEEAKEEEECVSFSDLLKLLCQVGALPVGTKVTLLKAIGDHPEGSRYEIAAGPTPGNNNTYQLQSYEKKKVFGGDCLTRSPGVETIFSVHPRDVQLYVKPGDPLPLLLLKFIGMVGLIYDAQAEGVYSNLGGDGTFLNLRLAKTSTELWFELLKYNAMFYGGGCAAAALLFLVCECRGYQYQRLHISFWPSGIVWWAVTIYGIANFCLSKAEGALKKAWVAEPLAVNDQVVHPPSQFSSFSVAFMVFLQYFILFLVLFVAGVLGKKVAKQCREKNQNQ